MGNIGEMSEIKTQKNLCKYSCASCGFNTRSKNDYARHCGTRKHHATTNGLHNDPIGQTVNGIKYDCTCGKTYTCRQNLRRHKNKCTHVPPVPAATAEMFLKVLEDNKELRDMLCTQQTQSDRKQTEMMEQMKNQHEQMKDQQEQMKDQQENHSRKQSELLEHHDKKQNELLGQIKEQQKQMAELIPKVGNQQHDPQQQPAVQSPILPERDLQGCDQLGRLRQIHRSRRMKEFDAMASSKHDGRRSQGHLPRYPGSRSVQTSHPLL